MLRNNKLNALINWHHKEKFFRHTNLLKDTLNYKCVDLLEVLCLVKNTSKSSKTWNKPSYWKKVHWKKINSCPVQNFNTDSIHMYPIIFWSHGESWYRCDTEYQTEQFCTMYHILIIHYFIFLIHAVENIIWRNRCIR